MTIFLCKGTWEEREVGDKMKNARLAQSAIEVLPNLFKKFTSLSLMNHEQGTIKQGTIKQGTKSFGLVVVYSVRRLM
jgi:hypothetical protein